MRVSKLLYFCVKCNPCEKKVQFSTFYENNILKDILQDFTKIYYFCNTVLNCISFSNIHLYIQWKYVLIKK